MLCLIAMYNVSMWYENWVAPSKVKGSHTNVDP